MAEYLCEEDMNTGEYISRDVALRQLNATCLATDCDNYNGVRCRACAYADAMDFIDAIPAADVQPVNQWISVEDRLPESEKEVLVWYKYTWGAAPTSYGFGINVWYSNAKQWRDGCLLKGVEVLYWQPLPEPPKDGEANE